VGLKEASRKDTAAAGGAFGYANFARRYDICAKASGVPADRKGKWT
jgi:hypothetical protein